LRVVVRVILPSPSLLLPLKGYFLLSSMNQGARSVHLLVSHRKSLSLLHLEPLYPGMHRKKKRQSHDKKSLCTFNT
jgi:hypothetical protein